MYICVCVFVFIFVCVFVFIFVCVSTLFIKSQNPIWMTQSSFNTQTNPETSTNSNHAVIEEKSLNRWKTITFQDAE